MKYAIALTAALFAGSPVHSTECLPWIEALSKLEENFGERFRMIAVRADGGLLVITEAPNGSWSAVMVSPEGIGCLQAWGHGIEFEAPGTDM